jgi:5'-3' exonuclease
MKKDIIIDADHIAFFVAESKTYKNSLGGKLVNEKVDMKPYKEHFKEIIQEYIEIAEVESIAHDWTIGKVKVVLSDVTNFRYDLYPHYKNKRPEENMVRSKLRKWARKKYICVENTEADDVVAYYVRKGGIGFTTDKDLYMGVEGLWYNTHHMARRWATTTSEEAEYFFKCQILAGDGVDGIPSIKGVGLATAKKLLKEYGDSYNDIVRIFEDYGYDKDYMITMARLVSMAQWSKKKGIKLWQLPRS